MFTWILKNNYLFTVIAVLIFLIEVKVLISYFRQLKQHPRLPIDHTIDMVGKTFALLSIVLICGLLDSSVRNEYIHDSDWATIYTQNEKNCVSLKLKSHGTYPGEFTTSTCSRLDKDYIKFKQLINDSNPHGSITLETNLEVKDQNDTRTINLDSKNIIIEDELNENSKITKIEYVSTSKIKRTLFGFASDPFDSNMDGDLRITISQK